MSHDRFERAREIFLVACALEQGERKAYLRERCGGDDQLLGEVEELLRFHVEEATGGTDGTPLRFETTPLKMPETVCRYRLIRKLGEGGMGEVYEAEQAEPIRRRVALKVIKWGMDTDQVMARFESERQALALMDHPCIARVYDAGATEHGRPFFAMELVRGIPITEYCDRNRLTTKERLRLFTRVCGGVQHAHQKGIMHRDLKPSNILVAASNEGPIPKIIDFGIAKATSQRLTERTVFTEFGQWIGTPEYMSPEQADMNALDIDTRTDVYSLGVVLYELLVGTQPLEAKRLRSSGIDEMRRMIRDLDPPRPSTRLGSLGDESSTIAERQRSDPQNLARTLRGDLDWITMRALEKDRTRRYGSPAELANDIERHLHDQPVVAGPPGSVYRIGKFVRRHRLGVSAASLVILALVAGIVGTTIGLVQARRQAEAARLVADVMVSMSADLNPSIQRGRVTSPDDMLDRAVVRAREELQAEPLVQARMLMTLGDAYKEAGRPERARPLLEESASIYRRELGENHPDYALAISYLGDLLEREGDLAGARKLHEEALAARRQVLGGDHRTVGWSLRSLGAIAQKEGRLDDAAALLTESWDITSRAAGEGSIDIAITLYLQAGLAWERGDLDGATRLYQQSLEIREQQLGADHPAVGEALLDYGRLLFTLGEPERAKKLTNRALNIFRRVFGSDHHKTVLTMGQLAVIEFFSGNEASALDLYRRIVDAEAVTGRPILDELNTYPEFRAMVEGFGSEPL